MIIDPWTEVEEAAIPLPTGLSRYLTPEPEDEEPDDSAYSPLNTPPAGGRSDSKARRPILARRPGYSGTPRDWELFLVLLTEQVRREMPNGAEEEIQETIRQRYEDAVANDEPMTRLVTREYARAMRVAKAWDSRNVRDTLEAAAIVRTPEWQEIDALLAGHPMGRPTDRALCRAIFARAVLTNQKPEIRCNYQDFLGSNHEIDWAFLGLLPGDDPSPLLRDESSARKTLQRALERHSSDAVLLLNLIAVRPIIERHPEGGRRLLVDGTDVPAFKDQRPTVNAEHRGVVLGDSGAWIHSHGARLPHWIGWRLLVIADMATGMPLIWKLVSKGTEAAELYGLLARLLELAPWLEPEYIVGDAAFDWTRLIFDLQHELGVTPVFPLRKTLSSKWDWSEDFGVPRCSQHGLMKMIQAEGFNRRPSGRQPDENFAVAKQGCEARIRWRCETCGVLVTTWMHRNARLYTKLPHAGEHQRAAMRIALMLHRNGIETVMSVLKRRGFGDDGHNKPRWATQQAHVEWLAATALLGMTLRREVHESGFYNQIANEAWRLGLVKRAT